MNCRFKDKFSEKFKCNMPARPGDEYCYYHEKVMLGLVDTKSHKETLKELPKAVR